MQPMWCIHLESIFLLSNDVYLRLQILIAIFMDFDSLQKTAVPEQMRCSLPIQALKAM